ncbi:efflux RND transporter periplasmic adaptor subunit [Vibrio anguillarum]|nr:efflux RND transporter periplasmic adaptor subunit [Vibrio anguillarum]AQM20805.1 efflux transporter periplasmic adaptor subunit [Vibrio anguillarum]AUB85822.1 efflux RND transporter periplasmic adaptor subunit [Vibrio anguillarum]AUB89260.1 efflux RND transporter periplasmic adaptor subunit [Vibrio anguillarum]AUB92701.1 efflux RND transporter periplasmic adaptor subunit [Vibrio anguillarum]AUB96135.1 efflux RND transporter periplasmic adaptor subunit [Vibrio anguillarum]
MGMKRRIWIACIALITSGYWAVGYADDRYIVTYEQIPHQIAFEGVVQPVNKGTVAAQTSGRVVGVYVDVNDFVKKGDVLLEISAIQQSASLDASQAQLTSAEARNREAQAQLKRYRLLFPKGAISQDQMDGAEAQARSAAAAVKAAKAAVVQAKESLGYTNITAPYDGVVTERHVELGETVAPGTALLSGFSFNELRVETAIPQRYQPAVTNVAQFQVIMPTGDKITPIDYSLFSYADPQSHTFKIRLELPRVDQTNKLGQVMPGMWVKTEFNYGQREVMLIPVAAVIRRAELSAVYRIVDDKRLLNPVRLGQTYGEYVEVLSGLEQGDTVASRVFTQVGE